MKRKPPTLKDKLAAALLQIVRYDAEECTFVPVIPYAEAKSLTADQIIARFHFDHGIAHAHDGPAAPWNLTPMPVEDHRRKTATIDIPRIAKSKRIQKREAGVKKPRAIRAWRRFDGTIVHAERER